MKTWELRGTRGQRGLTPPPPNKSSTGNIDGMKDGHLSEVDLDLRDHLYKETKFASHRAVSCH